MSSNLTDLLSAGKEIASARKIAESLPVIMVTGVAVRIPAKVIKGFCSKLDHHPDVTNGDPWQADCIAYLGRSRARGYGNVSWKNGTTTMSVRAHRLGYMIGNGPIPFGNLVRHTCHNKLCVSPAHLTVGTSQDNSDDMVLAGRSLDQRGTKNHNAKLTEQERWDVLERHEAGESYKTIAESMVVHTSTIAKVCTERRRVIESDVAEVALRLPSRVLKQIVGFGIEYGSDADAGKYEPSHARIKDYVRQESQKAVGQADSWWATRTETALYDRIEDLQDDLEAYHLIMHNIKGTLVRFGLVDPLQLKTRNQSEIEGLPDEEHHPDGQ